MPTLADLLVDFGKPAAPQPFFGGAAASGPDLPFGLLPSGEGEPGDGPAFPDRSFDHFSEDGPAAPASPSEADVEAIVAEAVAKAEAELAARLEEEFAQRLEAQAKAHADELEHLQREAGEAAGMRIADEFAAIEKRLGAYTSDVVARLLAPVLTEDLQRRAVASLVSVIHAALRDSGAVRIRVRGPLSLFEMLEARLGEHSGRIEFTETADLDLQVAVDESLYETRLSEWSGSLAEAVP